jgi:hypothetical protein
MVLLSQPKDVWPETNPLHNSLHFDFGQFHFGGHV